MDRVSTHGITREEMKSSSTNLCLMKPRSNLRGVVDLTYRKVRVRLRNVRRETGRPTVEDGLSVIKDGGRGILWIHLVNNLKVSVVFTGIYIYTKTPVFNLPSSTFLFFPRLQRK